MIKPFFSELYKKGMLIKTNSNCWGHGTLCFIEMWQQEYISGLLWTSIYHVLVHRDKNCRHTEQRRDGIAIFLNNRWRNPEDVTVKEHLCTMDTDITGSEL